MKLSDVSGFSYTVNLRGGPASRGDIEHAFLDIEEFVSDLITRIVRDADELALQLIADKPSLYSEVDRFRAEAEFRLAIAPPLLALFILGATTTSWYLLIGVPFVFVIYWQGLVRRRTANDVIGRLVRMGTIKSAALDEEAKSLRAVLSGDRASREAQATTVSTARR